MNLGRRSAGIHLLGAVCLLGQLMFASLSLGLDSEEGSSEVRKLSQYDMTGKGAAVDGLEPTRVEGLGLVVGLKGTGSSPPPNNYRRMMIEQMKKRDVRDPAKILDSAETAIVLLRAYIPPGARKGDMIDVEVWVPPGDETTSLRDGVLLEAELKEMLVAQGGGGRADKTLPGDTLVKVDGPVLVLKDTSGKPDEESASLRKGKILGRGRVMLNRDFRLTLDDGKKSKQRSRRVAFRVNQRFRSSESSSQKGIANPVTFEHVLLSVPEEYRYNIERFLHVVRRIPMSESTTFQDNVLGILEAELMNPQTTIEATLRLEAIGAPAIPALKEGLLSDDELVRFCSAQSLAYMRESSSYPFLAKMADRSNVYRAYALASLASRDNPISRTHLTTLLDSESAEARYGAFRALWLIEPTNYSIRSVTLGPDKYALHLVETKASPMVHVSRNFRREIVLFNPNQPVKTPLTWRAGENIYVNASAGSDQVHLASIRSSSEGPVERRQTASLSLGDIITKASELGATYPDIVEMLMQASQGHNLSGRLEINALPKAMPLETLELIANADDAKRWQSFASSTPSLFETGETVGSISKLRAVSEDTSLSSEGEFLDEEESEAKPVEPEKKRRSIRDLFKRSAN